MNVAVNYSETKFCTGRESNPGRIRGRDAWYLYTTSAMHEKSKFWHLFRGRFNHKKFEFPIKCGRFLFDSYFLIAVCCFCHQAEAYFCFLFNRSEYQADPINYLSGLHLDSMQTSSIPLLEPHYYNTILNPSMSRPVPILTSCIPKQTTLHPFQAPLWSNVDYSWSILKHMHTQSIPFLNPNRTPYGSLQEPIQSPCEHALDRISTTFGCYRYPI